MMTTAIHASHPPLATPSRLACRLPYFVALMKPRVMALAVFTALVGMLNAPSRVDPLLGFVAILAIAAGAGAAGALNMWYDADIDGVMSRTARRPIPRRKISRSEALVFGLVLACGAVAVLAIVTDLRAAALLAFAIFFYVVVYTMWLKRQTPQNIVIGGAAGALPPVIGWAAATGEIGLEPLILFLIIFLWTPPHFWALALNRGDEYARAGRSLLDEPRQRVRSSSTARFWPRFQCCRAYWDLPGRSMARLLLSAEESLLRSPSNCTGAARSTGKRRIACSHSRSLTYSCSLPRS